MLDELKAEPRASRAVVTRGRVTSLDLVCARCPGVGAPSGQKENENAMLRIVEVILELIREVKPIVEAVGRRDGDLGRQLRNALNSTLLNTVEASRQRGRRRTNHYAIAVGSAQEAQAALQAAEAWGFIEGVPEAVAARFRHVVGTLVKNAR